MKSLKKMIGGMAMIALSLCFAACSSDDEPSYSTAAVTNSELKTILTGKGYQFNEQGNLLLDDKANQTTQLDLSGTNISVDALSELTILPNLTEVSLKNNGYGPVFDFAKLPAQITGIDLTGNEIYDFEGLVSVNVVNDERETTVLHNLTKLYLPETAKYNVEDLMPYYETAGSTTDMQMANASGTLEKYNTLREIPDEYFRAYVKSIYPSLFSTDTQIDISKPLDIEEQGRNVTLGLITAFDDIDKIKSVDGVEYFINNPYYRPFVVALVCTSQTSVKYLMPRSNIKALVFYNVDTPSEIDLSKATSLSNITFSNNNGIETLDLVNTAIANQETTDFDVLAGNALSLISCKKLKEIEMNPSSKGITAELTFQNLPALKNLDLSSIVGMERLTIQSLPACSITYPMDKLKYRYRTSNGELYELPLSSRKIELIISSEVNDLVSTKAFIEKFGSSMTVRVKEL